MLLLIPIEALLLPELFWQNRICSFLICTKSLLTQYFTLSLVLEEPSESRSASECNQTPVQE